jgi:integrase
MPIYKMEGKKDGLQKYRVRINYKDAFGNYKSLDRVCYGRAEALDLERKLTADREKPVRKFTELYDSYLKHLKISIRQTSFAQKEKDLRLYVLPVFQKAKLPLSTSSLLKWKTDLAQTGLAPRTLQNIYTSFSSLLTWGEKMEFIDQNPLRKIGNFRKDDFTPPADRLHYYTAPEYLRFALCARQDAEKTKFYGYYTFFSIAFYTGCRKGEINALKWSDLEGNILHIRRSVTHKVKGISELETPPKTKSSYRDLQVPDPLLRILEFVRKIQEKDPAFTSDYRICGGVRTLSDTAIENKNQQFAKDAGLPHIKVHDFRHSHASLLANEGINIQEIARRLGHSNVETTWNTYSHLYPREEERAVRILNEIK